MNKEDKLSEMMHENTMKAAEIMGEYLDGKRHGSELIKQASLTITQYFKYRATRGVEAGIKLAVVKMVATSKSDMRSLIEGALPEYSVRKALADVVGSSSKQSVDGNGSKKSEEGADQISVT